MWQLGGMRWRDLVRIVWKHCWRDEVLGRAGELAYFFLLSIFPLLLVLIALLGSLVGEGGALRISLFEYLRAVIPDQAAFRLVRDNLVQISEARGGKVSVGVLLSLWASSRGVDAVGRGLARAYESRYVRPLWVDKAISVGLALVFTLLAALGLVVVFYGGAITEFAAGRLAHGGSILLRLWSWLQRPLAVFFVLIAFDLLYNFSTGGLRRRGLRWFTPGAIVGVAIWLGASYAFQLYLSQVAFYTRVYGSLGAVIILLLWFYLTGAAILIGGEVNAAILRAEKARQKKQEAAAVAEAAAQPQETAQ
jgi:membrane protein